MRENTAGDDARGDHVLGDDVLGDHVRGDAPDIDVVLVTGLSGAGRGTAAKVLEDLGWYVADNLPPELIADRKSTRLNSSH